MQQGQIQLLYEIRCVYQLFQRGYVDYANNPNIAFSKLLAALRNHFSKEAGRGKSPFAREGARESQTRTRSRTLRIGGKRFYYDKDPNPTP